MVDEEAFVSIVQQEERRLLHVAKHDYSGVLAAPDVVYASILELWEDRANIKNEAHLRALLVLRVRSRCMDCGKKDGDVVYVPIDAVGDEHDPDTDVVQTGCVTEETLPDRVAWDLGLLFDVRRALSRLPYIESTIVRMCVQEGLTQHESARILRISRDQVARRLYKAIKTLRVALKDYAPFVTDSVGKNIVPGAAQNTSLNRLSIETGEAA